MASSKRAQFQALRVKIEKGGPAHHHEKNQAAGKMFARERIAALFDAGSFVEDGMFANCVADDLPADGVVTGAGLVAGRAVAVMANDSTVKAGSWGPKTVEKILRIQETAMRLQVPLVYLVDSAGARITDQLQMFPGRRGAGRIFFNQVALSGRVPQLCALFGPSAAGGAYIPAFCDLVVMVDGNASMYLGSPRMAEMVIGEKVSLEEMGGAKMHCTLSGSGDVLVENESQAIESIKRALSYLPSHFASPTPSCKPRAPKLPSLPADFIPDQEGKPFDMLTVLDAIVDDGSMYIVKELYAPEVINGFARLDGHAIGVVANQPKVKGGTLFVASAQKAARFINLCDAFGLPLLFCADVAGFMIGSKVEREGIIRAGARMIAAVSSATVPKVSVIVRKAYGAGLYAMCGPAFEPEACIALPHASIAVMGAAAAVNAVFYNKIADKPEGPEREAFIQQLRNEYEEDISLQRIASELVVDAVLPESELRAQLIQRFAFARDRIAHPVPKKTLVWPM